MIACLGAGCGSDDTTTMDLSADLSAPVADLSVPADLSVVSQCGQPGDPGNSVGVGKYCVVQADCRSGTICTHAFVAAEYFCTIPCSPSNPSMCGENAGCACNSGQCGCLPAACGGLPEG